MRGRSRSTSWSGRAAGCRRACSSWSSCDAALDRPPSVSANRPVGGDQLTAVRVPRGQRLDRVGPGVPPASCAWFHSAKPISARKPSTSVLGQQLPVEGARVPVDEHPAEVEARRSGAYCGSPGGRPASGPARFLVGAAHPGGRVQRAGQRGAWARGTRTQQPLDRLVARRAGGRHRAEHLGAGRQRGQPRKPATAARPPRSATRRGAPAGAQLARSASSRAAKAAGSQRTSACTAGSAASATTTTRRPAGGRPDQRGRGQPAAQRLLAGPQVGPGQQRPAVEQQRGRVAAVGDRLGARGGDHQRRLAGRPRSSTRVAPEVRTGTPRERPAQLLGGAPGADHLAPAAGAPPHSGQAQRRPAGRTSGRPAAAARPAAAPAARRRRAAGGRAAAPQASAGQVAAARHLDQHRPAASARPGRSARPGWAAGRPGPPRRGQLGVVAGHPHRGRRPGGPRLRRARQRPGPAGLTSCGASAVRARPADDQRRRPRCGARSSTSRACG